MGDFAEVRTLTIDVKFDKDGAPVDATLRNPDNMLVGEVLETLETLMISLVEYVVEQRPKEDGS